MAQMCPYTAKHATLQLHHNDLIFLYIWFFLHGKCGLQIMSLRGHSVTWQNDTQEHFTQHYIRGGGSKINPDDGYILQDSKMSLFFAW